MSYFPSVKSEPLSPTYTPISSSSAYIKPSPSPSSSSSSSSSLSSTSTKSEIVTAKSEDIKSTTPSHITFPAPKPIPIQRETLSCPTCKTSEIHQDYAHGINVCTSCGLVVGNVVSETSEWRSFSDDKSGKQDNNRVGGPESGLLEEIGLSTMIGRDSDGNTSALGRFQNQQTITPQHRQLIEGFKKSQRLASALSLPQSIVERCNEIYKLVTETKDLKAKKQEAVIAACMLIALRQENVPRTINEVCAVGDCTKKDVGKYFTRIKQLGTYKRIPSKAAPSAASYIDRFANHLNLPPNVSKAAIYIYAKAEAKKLFQGQNPATLAGAALYMAANLTQTHKKQFSSISHVTNMAASTLRSAYKTLYNNRLSGLVDDKFATLLDINNLPEP